nr:hypothetical protein [Tanacetum cinerariifolium]
MSQRREQEAQKEQELLEQEQAVEEKQEFTPSTTYTIHLTKNATVITNPSEPTRRIYHNHNIFYDGDDDEVLFPDEVKRIQKILEKTSFDAITPDFLITDSLSMGDEHLSIILKMESDELIKSSVENFVPNLSESEDLSDIESECNVPVCDDFTTVSNPLFDADNDFSSSDDKSSSDEDVSKENLKFFSNPLFDEEIISTKIDPHHFNTESDLIESLLNRDILIISSPKYDSLLEEFSGELAHIDLIPPGINEADFKPEEDIYNDDYDSEGDILFLEELLSNYSPSLPENKSFHFDVSSSPRPLAKLPDDGIYFEPDMGLLTAKVEVKKDVDYSKIKVKSEFSPYKKEIESNGQHEKKDVKDEIEIVRAALIQQEDDLNSDGDVVEGVLGVGGDDSNSLKTVDRLSKSDEVGSDNVVRGFKDVKSLSSKRISVCNIVSDNDDMVADGNNSKVDKVYVADRMVSDLKKSIESVTKGKYAKFKNVIVGEKKCQHKNLQSY